MVKIHSYCVAAIALITSLIPADSAKSQNNDQIFELGEIIISGEQKRVVEQVTTVDQVTAEEIEKSGAKTLDEAIDLMPGIYVRNGGDGTPRIDIRGMRTRNVQLLLDGVPLNSTFDGQFDPRSIPVENIAEIKVTRGGSSVLYGPGGNAAVINIITKSATEGLQTTADFEYGASKSRNGKATLSWGGDKVLFFMSGSYLDQDYFELSDDFSHTAQQPGDKRLNSFREDKSFYSNVTYKPTDKTNMGLSFNYHQGEYGKPPSTIEQKDSIYARRTRFERVDDFDSYSIQASISHELNEMITVRPQLYFNQFNELTNGYDDDTYSTQSKNRAFHSDAQTSIFGGGVQTAFRFDKNLLTFALDARNENWNADGYTVGKGNAVTTVDEKHDIQIYSSAVEGEISLSDPLSLVLGVGYAAQERDEENDDDFTYLAGLRYALSEHTTLRGSIARKIRFPTLRDLYETGRANPYLTTEITHNYEVAIEQNLPAADISFSVGLFRVDAEDFIEADDNGIAQNIEELRFQGVETSLNYTGIKDLDLAFGYTFLESENLSGNATTKELQNRPEHKITGKATYTLDPGLKIWGEYLYVNGSKALSRSSITPTQTLELEEYHLVNLGISKDLDEGRVQLYGRIENLLDEDYQHSYGFEQPGITAFVGIKTKL